jgi:hypothetical protein
MGIAFEAKLGEFKTYNPATLPSSENFVWRVVGTA